VKAPHKTAHGGWKVKHSPQPPHGGGGGGGGPKKKSPHKQPPKPKPAPKPTKTKAHKKPRKLSPGYDVACCTAEAVGLLLGWGWDEVLALYWRTASDPDAGVPILATLQAAGITDVAPVPEAPRLAVHSSGSRPGLPGTSRESTWGGLILGVSLPEPHAVAVTPDGTWWSWGQPLNPCDWPDLTIEETWAVTWPP
jgi:hypothetical protein